MRISRNLQVTNGAYALTGTVLFLYNKQLAPSHQMPTLSFAVFITATTSTPAHFCPLTHVFPITDINGRLSLWFGDYLLSFVTPSWISFPAPVLTIFFLIPFCLSEDGLLQARAFQRPYLNNIYTGRAFVGWMDRWKEGGLM